MANLWFPFYHHLSSSVMHSNYDFFTAVPVVMGLNNMAHSNLPDLGRRCKKLGPGMETASFY
jgi:hypothetical protein